MTAADESHEFPNQPNLRIRVRWDLDLLIANPKDFVVTITWHTRSRSREGDGADTNQLSRYISTENPQTF